MDADTPGAPALLGTALALALASAVSLGLARFAYALLLPAMRADLAWTYFLAGAMNTVNAAGYLLGALVLPMMLRQLDARRVMLGGGLAACVLLTLHGFARSNPALLGLRLLLGVASAASFVAGGVLAARLAAHAPRRSGLVLGIYYGGTGLGIAVSAWLVPPLVALGDSGWTRAWMALGALALGATWATAWWTRTLAAPPLRGAPRAPFAVGPYAFGLAAYTMFGLGYIGYMTFIVTLLREQGMSSTLVTAFFTVLGLGVVASSWLWAGLLQRHRGGVPLALLNALLAVATLMPVLSTQPVVVFVSGALFGSVFLSVVASTTALVRHNAPPASWPAGIAAFTIVFALGQIVGPSAVGWIADGVQGGDGAAGLVRGLGWSTAALMLGALLALRQRPVVQPAAP